MKKTSGICPQCGEEFWYYPSGYAKNDGVKTYCSNKCKSDAAWLHPTCPVCGVVFTCRRSDPRTCCSKRCGGLNGTERITFACEACGKEVTRNLSDYKGAKNNHFCSSACYGQWLKQNPMPHIAARRESRLARICKQCGKGFEITPSQLKFKNYGSFCSGACRSRWQGKQPGAYIPPVRRGPLNPRWKGGRIYYYGPDWNKQQRAARARDNHTCQECGIEQKHYFRRLDVHHKRPFREFGLARYQEANHLDNLITLCARCHTLIENISNIFAYNKRRRHF